VLGLFKKAGSPSVIALRKQRGPDVEGAFGDITHNMGVRRFML